MNKYAHRKLRWDTILAIAEGSVAGQLHISSTDVIYRSDTAVLFPFEQQAADMI
jgi:hypothetical protein